jgi:hypothetical protein
MKNIVLYIDEVNDLIRSITHNDALDKVLNKVYTTLITLIKNCKKIICSDATIDDNTLNLLSSRKHNRKLLLIENSNKKFKGVKATRHNDESKFINELRDHIKNKNYFLFGADLCTTITYIHNLLLNEFPEQKEDFILITSETSFRPSNANIQFKNKYVFYSPSITTGVSFVFEGAKQEAREEDPPRTSAAEECNSDGIKADAPVQGWRETRIATKGLIDGRQPNKCRR